MVFVLPGPLRELTGGRSEARVPLPAAGTLEEAFGSLRVEHPGVYDRIFTEQRELRPHVNVFVDGADIRWTGGLESPVRQGSEVVILPAVSGG
ncbi:MAG: ubiquitin-like small modifier protein 1 [Longimicrobiales bacterium]|nr:ubiquitin-like small modifier protein 1 [Longimicrobiales bacterium]